MTWKEYLQRRRNPELYEDEPPLEIEDGPPGPSLRALLRLARARRKSEKPRGRLYARKVYTTAPDDARCAAATAGGTRCRRRVWNSGYCYVHRDLIPTAEPVHAGEDRN
jgi:hypothetical protein